jgi:hypothetical protein
VETKSKLLSLGRKIHVVKVELEGEEVEVGLRYPTAAEYEEIQQYVVERALKEREVLEKSLVLDQYTELDRDNLVEMVLLAEGRDIEAKARAVVEEIFDELEPSEKEEKVKERARELKEKRRAELVNSPLGELVTRWRNVYISTNDVLVRARLFDLAKIAASLVDPSTGERLFASPDELASSVRPEVISSLSAKWNELFLERTQFPKGSSQAATSSESTPTQGGMDSHSA